MANEFDEDFETFDETAEEWTGEEEDDEPRNTRNTRKENQEINHQETENVSKSNFSADDLTNNSSSLLAEIVEYGKLAASITTNAKGDELLQALDLGFQKLEELGTARKVVIFTESRRTQSYLYELLSQNAQFAAYNPSPRSKTFLADSLSMRLMNLANRMAQLNAVRINDSEHSWFSEKGFGQFPMRLQAAKKSSALGQSGKQTAPVLLEPTVKSVLRAAFQSNSKPKVTSSLLESLA